MSRVQAEALVLVNWKGVFYERYELDRHVTALEGDNGAGKTTVMIAAYVVLLPDMTRLRFTNLGETGATGGDKGIWGRLGELGRPSYSAIDFRLPRGERVLAGVHLERKGEPTVEPTPFLVTGLSDDVRLQDLLLLTQGELDLVPELGEFRENVARHGGRLQVCSTARDYFRALFELGITPLRMGTDEERNKLNEMLKTSMTGGMSRGLLSELRSFLLKKESGLANTLQGMRENLAACRRTRTEVVEAQRLEREIGSVYEAGNEMFRAAVAATHRRAEEMSRRVGDAEKRHLEAEEAEVRAKARLVAAQESLQEATQAKSEAESRRGDALAWMERVDEALRWQREVHGRADIEEASRLALLEASATKERAAVDVREAERRVATTSDARERAAEGLSDLQKGLDELNRRAHAHRTAQRHLRRAREVLRRGELDPANATAVRLETARRLEGVDDERRALKRQLDDAEAHRQEFAQAHRALEAILGGPPDQPTYELGSEALAKARRWRELAAARGDLGQQLANAEAMALRQAQAFGLAAELGLRWPEGGGRAAVDTELSAAEESIERNRSSKGDAVASVRRDQEALSGEEARTARLRERSEAYAAAQRLAQEITAFSGLSVVDPETLAQARAAIAQGLTTATERLKGLREQREQLLGEARQLRSAGGTFPPALLKTRDLLTADLLATHFDDVTIDEAAEVEARLGPLVHALVVENLELATRRLQGRPEELPTVWLVAEDTALKVDPDDLAGTPETRDVVVDGPEARRVTRLPQRPTVGRAARERKAADLQAAAEQLEAAIASTQAEVSARDGASSNCEELWLASPVWRLGDPARDIAENLERIDALRRGIEAGEERAAVLDVEHGVLKARRGRALQLLPDAELLDADDGNERVQRLTAAVDEAETASVELARVGSAPRTLELHQAAFRRRPMSDEDMHKGTSKLQASNELRDRLEDAIESLEYVSEHQEAFQWADAEGQLASKKALTPTMKAQLEQAKRALKEAQDAERAARARRDEADTSANEADAAFNEARRRLDEAREKLAATEIAEPSEAMRAIARDRVRDADRAYNMADEAISQIQKDLGRRETELESAEEAAGKARVAAEDERKQAKPALDAWERLGPQVEAERLLPGSLTERFERVFGGLGSVNIWSRAKEHRAQLVERLRNAHGGPEVLGTVEQYLDATDQITGEGYLQAWLVVRDWLRRRLPAQVADVDEPLVALERFRDHLEGLVDRLERQERELRGASEDVARGIDVQVRKARGRVRRLSQHLRDVRFGSIQGIRVQMKPVERMERVLRALRTGAAQELLFQADMPVEDALAEIFKRFGGGKTGGQKLLDYREYIELAVEVMRQDGSTWEPANPTRLSTGEAIGVGAALMMVVLTEWERDANLLRGRRSYGSMRFLFLDEANRLDKANLGTVFDLCRNLDLQLLVAAPEVGRAEGCTVFRLVRTRGEDGQDEVRVSGRRVVGSDALAES